MDSLQSEVFQALRSIEIPEDKTLAAAVALARKDDAIPAMAADITLLKPDVAELKSDVALLKSDVAVLKSDVAALKADVAAVKADTARLQADSAVLKWMLGFVLAFQLAQLIKMFTH